ncbi:hypothetical protein JX265_013817 [Neoarthrinium moseri]|uniref:Prolyl 4-hydroxylase alpha subunit domain-containing protein n=1 Tax=Neoarthrinium moseri TaxID=1658444 RepID=A0A9Q0AHA4_9PEZI|nr:hypothetical protein JX265_013817 [Neoarthrinium moseri]
MTATRVFSAVAAVAALLAAVAPLLAFRALNAFSSGLVRVLDYRGLSNFLAFILLASQPPHFICQSHAYKTEVVSVDPLVIYFHDFLAPAEMSQLLDAAEPLFKESLLTGNNGQVRASRRRTSRTAKLLADDAAVECVLRRASDVMEGMLVYPRDDIQPPQLARYTAGQHFDVHADWFDTPQERRPDSTGVGSSWNRLASFFAILEDGCTGGETWFPHVQAPALPGDLPGPSGRSSVWREHEQGGLAFRPVKGGALFWMNLFANGTGDDRTRHAGLPVQSGLKTGMNIWPRVYYP